MKRIANLLAECAAGDLHFLAGNGKMENGTGYFVKPTIIDNPPTDSLVATEEAFGT